jgi:hypothetical protein
MWRACVKYKEEVTKAKTMNTSKRENKVQSQKSYAIVAASSIKTNLTL